MLYIDTFQLYNVWQKTGLCGYTLIRLKLWEKQNVGQQRNAETCHKNKNNLFKNFKI